MQRNNTSNYSGTWYKTIKYKVSKPHKTPVIKSVSSHGSNESMFPSINSIHGWDFNGKNNPSLTVNRDCLQHYTQAISLQNTRYSVTCDLEINQNIHLRKIMKYDSSSSKFVSFSFISFIKICLVWNANTVFDKTCLNKMSIIYQNRKTMF